MHWYDFAQPHPEVYTAYTSYIMALMAEIAGILKKDEDIPLYVQYRDGCKRAYQAMAKTERFTLDTDRWPLDCWTRNRRITPRSASFKRWSTTAGGWVRASFPHR